MRPGSLESASSRTQPVLPWLASLTRHELLLGRTLAEARCAPLDKVIITGATS